MIGFASVFYTNIPFIAQTLLALLVLVSLVRQGSRVLLLSQWSFYGVYIGSQGVILESRQAKQAAQLKRVRYISHLFTLLEFEVLESANRQRSLIQLPLLIDSISEAQHKELHGYLNHSFQSDGN